MGWDVHLELPDGTTARVESHQEGSTIAIGGSDEADMCVTYNYSPIYYEKFGQSLPDYLKDKRARNTIKFLEKGLKKFTTTDPTGSYWDKNEGNAGHMVVVLLAWARSNPDAIWRIWK
jgi:hypothetical protein